MSQARLEANWSVLIRFISRIAARSRSRSRCSIQLRVASATASSTTTGNQATPSPLEATSAIECNFYTHSEILGRSAAQSLRHGSAGTRSWTPLAKNDSSADDGCERTIASRHFYKSELATVSQPSARGRGARYLGCTCQQREVRPLPRPSFPGSVA